MKDFWFLKKLARNLHIYSGGNIGHAGAWLSQIPQKRFHYLKYILSTEKLTRINYIEIICHIYLRVLFCVDFEGVTDINLNGCIMWLWWPTNNENIRWFHIYECALSALPKGFSLAVVRIKASQTILVRRFRHVFTLQNTCRPHVIKTIKRHYVHIWIFLAGTFGARRRWLRLVEKGSGSHNCNPGPQSQLWIWWWNPECPCLFFKENARWHHDWHHLSSNENTGKYSNKNTGKYSNTRRPSAECI